MLGGGVIGLTAALKALLAGMRVTVVAHGLGAETTTANVAGLWGPYKVGPGFLEYRDAYQDVHLRRRGLITLSCGAVCSVAQLAWQYRAQNMAIATSIYLT